MALGKWILAGLAWSAFGPIGGILGFLLGRLFENRSQTTYEQVDRGASGTSYSGRRYSDTGTAADLSAALLVLMAAVMKADQVVKKSELDLVKRFLVSSFGEDQAKVMLLRLRELQKEDIPLYDVCHQIKTNTSYDTRYHTFDFLFSIASADGDVVKSELDLLRTIANRLGINNRDFLSIMGRHTAGNYRGGNGSYGHSPSSQTYSKDPFIVLGLDSSASDEDIKKAYRRLAMKYHPDKVEGMGDDIKKNAEAQFREINQAYETLKSIRRFK